ncbi:MAG: hypothetical protein HYY16_18995 [Planctomycetes bacterium]|nr:hypothetical protein [Planctomycetota bacterium]
MGRFKGLWVVVLCLAAAQTAAAQDLETRRRDVVRRAQEAHHRGDVVAATLLVGEAYALQSEIDWLDGRRREANENWLEAVKRGWRGTPPWSEHPEVAPSREAPPIRAPLLDQEEETRLEPPVRRRSRDEIDAWPYFAVAPYRHLRAGAWQSLMGTPPFEEALVMPQGFWRARGWMELLTADFTDVGGGGTSRWFTSSHQEVFEVDYSLTDTLMTGLRISAGELFEEEGQLLRVFQDGRQIVRSAQRDVDLDTLTARAKYAADWGLCDAGILVEVKIPLADESSMLSAQTIDFGVVGLVTKQMGSVTLHGNLGLVIPTGDPEVFQTGYDEVNSYLTGAVGLAWAMSDWLNLGVQLEGNSSAFLDIAVLDEPVLTMTGRGHIRLTDRMFLAGSLGRGVTELSGDWTASGALEVVF